MKDRSDICSMFKSHVKWTDIINSLVISKIPFEYLHSLQVKLANNQVLYIKSQEEFDQLIFLLQTMSNVPVPIKSLHLEYNIRKLRKSSEKKIQTITDSLDIKNDF